MAEGIANSRKAGGSHLAGILSAFAIAELLSGSGDHKGPVSIAEDAYAAIDVISGLAQVNAKGVNGLRVR